MSAEDWTIVGIVTAGAGAVVGGVVKLLGSRTERSADMEAAAEEWRSLAQTSRAAEAECMRRAAETQAHVEALREAMREQREDFSGRFRLLEREHAMCPERISTLERQVERLTMQSTPPNGIHPDELRAAQAAEEP